MIDLSRQPGLDFDDEAYAAEFTLPDYQRSLLVPRTYAMLTDMVVVFGAFMVFVIATVSEMSLPILMNRRILGVYAGAYLVFLVLYFLLFSFHD